MNIIEERTIALAGILQACKEVQSLARNGAAEESTYDSSLQSIMVLDAINTPAVYGGIAGVRSGLRLLADGILSSASAQNVEVLRYAMSVMQLQSQLYKNPDRFTQFANEVERLSSQTKDELPQACSAVYQKYVSTLQPQVIVQGEEMHLQNAEVPPQIRSLLLAGLRSAVLWQQKGGSRFRIVWERTRMQNAARSLIAKTYS